MDRQIFWILQEIPEFQNLINSSEVDDIRAKVCFKCGITGQQLLLFYYYFMNKVIYANSENLEKFAEKLDKNFCCLTESEIDKIRLGINKILKIDNYNDFYKFMNQTPPSKDELNKKLKQAFENSKLKKYHGTDEVRYVPSESNQVAYYFKKYEDIHNFIENDELLPNENQKWKEALNNFDIVKEFKYAFPNKEMTPLELIKFQREKYDEILFWDVKAFQKKKNNNKIGLSINKNKFVKKYEDEIILQNLTWRQLYIKLYLEDYCKFFPYIADFKQLYNLLDILKDEVIHFVLFISKEGYLKSDFNYIRAILSKLTSIKYLEFVYTRGVGIKLLKNIVKGISNAVKIKASIEHLKIIINDRYDVHSSKDLNILTILDNMPSLKVLDVSDVSLDINTILRIRNHLYYYKKITVLDLSHCNMNDEMSNELADGIMKAKALEKLYISGNRMKKGLSNILYNLAFQPSIKLIDISSNTDCDKKETSISLHKLIKMSQSVDTIIANRILQFNKELHLDFYYAVGDSNNLVYLDLSYNGKFSDLTSLGNAVAFNALKNGSLAYLDISFCDVNAERFKNFLKGLKISEEDHIKWYGYQFNTNVHKDNPDYFNKKFHCNLETLVLNGNDLNESVNYLDPKNSYMENLVKTFITQSPKLSTLILRKNNFNKYFLESISEALKEKNNIKYLSFSDSKIDGEKFKSLLPMFYEPLNINNKEEKKKENKKEIIQRKSNPNLHLEELDLSCNLLGYSGIETLSNALKINSTIKKINLFHNLFDVNGARRIGDVLKINNNLTDIDIGYNRIKNAGFKYIISALKENKKINLKYLGLKYNFINDKIFDEQMTLIEEDENIKLEEIDLKNNSLTSGFLAKFWDEKFTKMKKKLNLDIFDVLAYMTKDKLERTVWIPVGDEPDKGQIQEKIESCDRDCFIYDNSRLGIPLLMRKKRGRKTGKKKDVKCKNIFIEFIMPNSVNRMLKLGATSKFIVNGKARKVYKAGTKPDFLVVKKRKNP
jgi:Ran GTPase-activating protein (RanGAP) involved in mRNA processing and transport